MPAGKRLSVCPSPYLSTGQILRGARRWVGRCRCGNVLEDGERISVDYIESVGGEQATHQRQRSDPIDETHTELPLSSRSVSHMNFNVRYRRHGVEQSPHQVNVVRVQLRHSPRPLRQERVQRFR